MSRVALVYPYFRTKSPTELLFPPLGAASLASQLLRLGIETRIFDCTFDTLAGIQEKLVSYQPDIVGIYTMVTLSRNTFLVADMVRRFLPGSLLVSGGPLPTLYPEQYLRLFDAVFRGEADLSFPHFCHDYLDKHCAPGQYDGLSLEKYPGLFIQTDTFQVDIQRVHYREKELATFPLPYRGDFDHAAYQEVWLAQEGSKTTSLITTYGCPFDCDFCSRPVFGNLFRRRDLDSVFEEIEQVRSLGYDSLWIADDNFTLDIGFLREFCGRIRGQDISWSCLSRVTGIDGEIAALMKGSGCSRVYLGLETGNQDTLKLMNKKATVQEGKQAVHVFHAAGIEVAAFFIVGYPGETLASIEDTFRMALDLPLDSISFNVPYPLPGSRLFENVSKVEKNKDWNVENEITFLYESEFDPAWLERRISETMQAFAGKKK